MDMVYAWEYFCGFGIQIGKLSVILVQQHCFRLKSYVAFNMVVMDFEVVEVRKHVICPYLKAK